MSKAFMAFLRTETKHLEQAGLLRREPALGTGPGPSIKLGHRELLNLASSDYLGLSHHPEVKKAAQEAAETFGVGVGSTRLVTGTLPLHQELERAIAEWLGMEDTVVFASGYQANSGLFEALLGERDFVFCDEMVRPSLADGVRLSRARVFSYRSRDLTHLEDRLRRSRAARFRVIATDGVFALDGQPAPLADIYSLAEKYDALVVVDDSHGIGVWGEQGKGTHSQLGLAGKADVVTGTFGHALGGGAGGFIACRRAIATWLRQKSRPYLTSTALPPMCAAAALKAVHIARTDASIRDALANNTRTFRASLEESGLRIIAGEHPAVPIIIGHAVASQKMADLLYQKNIYALGFCHPVVPENEARIRAQVGSAHAEQSLRKAAATFGSAARELGL